MKDASNQQFIVKRQTIIVFLILTLLSCSITQLAMYDLYLQWQHTILEHEACERILDNFAIEHPDIRVNIAFLGSALTFMYEFPLATIALICNLVIIFSVRRILKKSD